MKIAVNADYDYSSYGVTEANGYDKWYHWEKVKRHTGIIFWAVTLLCIAVARFTKEIRRGVLEDKTFLIILGVCILIWLFVITPLHEILHILPLSKGKLGNGCIISIGKGTVSAIYNGFVTRKQYLMCLVLPFLFFAVLLGTLAFFTTGILKVSFILLLILSSLGSYTDIYMFFYSLKNLKKDDVLFGLYRKQKETSQQEQVNMKAGV